MSRAEQSRAEQSRAEQSRAEQSRAEQSRAEQSRGIPKNSRNIGCDICKILCMFLVIGFHFSDHGAVVLTQNQLFTLNWAVLAGMRIWGGICNCCFVLISGYFLCEKKFNYRSLVRLWFMVWCYSVFWGILCHLNHSVPVPTLFSWRRIFCPVIYNQYWFFSTYFILYLIFPFLNVVINHVLKIHRCYIIFLCLVGVSVLPTLGASWLSGVNSLLVFIVLYFIGASVKKRDFRLLTPLKLWIISLCCIVLEISSVFLMKFFQKDPFYFVWGMDKISVIITSFFLFNACLTIKIRSMRIIRIVSWISPAVFGVYLFHIGRFYNSLFLKIFNNEHTFYTWQLIPQLCMAMILIFVVAILFEKIRVYLLEKEFMRFISYIEQKYNLTKYVNIIYPR